MVNTSEQRPQVFAGRAGVDLTESICKYLEIPRGRSETRRFSDGETWVKIDENVRGRDCFVVQSTSYPVNEHVVELLLLLDALRRASAASITAIIPYFGYARQDRKDQGRVALSAKLMANLIVTAGAERVITMDLHSSQIQGFFDVPTDHLYASPVLVRHIRKCAIPDLVVVSADVGSIKRARAYAERLEAPLVLIDKRRPKANVSEVMNILGDVSGRNALLCDDIIDTAGTICNAAEAVQQNGAKDVYVAATHGVLSGPARERLTASGVKRLFVTDTIPPRKDETLECLETVSIAPFLGEAIRRIHRKQSVSALFEES